MKNIHGLSGTSLTNTDYSDLVTYLGEETSVGYDIVVAIGQSNMEGNNNGKDRAPNPRIKQYNQSDAVVDANDNLDHYAGTTGAGPAYSFCELILPFLNSNRTLLIVPAALGGTGFDDDRWNPGDDLYTNAVAQVNEAKALTGTNRVIVALWQQGESDVGDENTNYRQQFDTFVSSFRTAISESNLPFVVGTMPPLWVDNVTIRSLWDNWIRTAYQRVPYLGSIDTDGGLLFDAIHYDDVSMREIGNRYFSGFIAAYQNSHPFFEWTGTLTARSTDQTSFTVFTSKPANYDYLCQFRYREPTSENWTFSSELNCRRCLDVTGLTSGATYEVQARIQNVASGIWTEWSLSTSVTLTGATEDLSALGDIIDELEPWGAFSTADLDAYSHVVTPFQYGVGVVNDGTTDLTIADNYDASAVAHFDSAQGYLKTWLNQNQLERFTHSVTAELPLFSNSSGALLSNSNGRNSMRFPGTGGTGKLEAPNSRLVMNQTALSVFMRIEPDTFSGIQRLFHVLNFRYLLYINNGQNLALEVNTDVTSDSVFAAGTLPASGAFVVGGQVDWKGTEAKLLVDETIVATESSLVDDGGNGKWADAKNTVRVSDTSSGYDGLLESLIIFQEPLTDKLMRRVAQQMNASNNY